MGLKSTVFKQALIKPDVLNASHSLMIMTVLGLVAFRTTSISPFKVDWLKPARINLAMISPVC